MVGEDVVLKAGIERDTLVVRLYHQTHTAACRDEVDVGWL
jgi:hypothetical protein